MPPKARQGTLIGGGASAAVCRGGAQQRGPGSGSVVFGPVFAREATIGPRRGRFYLARAGYAAGLGLVVGTAWLVLTGTQQVREVGDLARFGALLFQVLAPLQAVMAWFFAALLVAGGVAQEKDRGTLVLLLSTDMTNRELVLGKLSAGLLLVVVMLLAGLPVFMFTVLFGGVCAAQIWRVMVVTLGGVVFCGSLGNMLAFWREKTFQALALVVLGLVAWAVVGEVGLLAVRATQWGGVVGERAAMGLSPWRAVLAAARPQTAGGGGWLRLDLPAGVFLGATGLGAAVLNAAAIWGVRRWNPPPERQGLRPGEAVRTPSAGLSSPFGIEAGGEGELQDSPSVPLATRALADQPAAACRPGRIRHVWNNPIIWREVRTWAYGRKLLLVRAAYLLLVALAAVGLHEMIRHEQLAAYAGGAAVLVPLAMLSLVLVNAQAVTSMTSERDAKALDLLLVTDLSPREIVFGKLGGVFYNTKEVVLAPMLLCAYLGVGGHLSAENLLYLCAGLAVLFAFVAVLGIHMGMIYANSHHAIVLSLGTVFFLFGGVALCLRMILAFSGSFQAQLHPFLAFMIGGGLGLYVALGVRNPSTAIAVASFLCPLATFYALASALLGATLGVFLVVVGAYGFATAAMLVPAVYEFDVATGRPPAEQ